MRIYVKVLPRSSKILVEKITDGNYRVKLTAPPVDGEANQQLTQVLANHFRISRSQVSIVGGKTAKTKIIDILS